MSFLKGKDSDLSSISPEDLPKHITCISIPPLNVLTSLHSSIHSLFAPALLSTDSFSHLPETFKKTLFDLDDQLSNSVPSGQNSDNLNSSNSNSDQSDFSTIRKPMDEVDFWENFRGRSVPKSVANDIRDQLRDAAEHFQLLLDDSRSSLDGDDDDRNNGDNNNGNAPNKNDLSYLETLFGESSPLETTLINIFNTNENEDTATYPPSRMNHLMQVIASALCSKVKSSMPPHPFLFTAPFSKVRSLLKLSVSLLTSYCTMCLRLSEIDFREVSHDFPWKDDNFHSATADALVTRLKGILSIRTTHEELKNLLPATQRQQFESSAPFAPFHEVDPLLVSPYSAPRWNEKVFEYNSNLSSVETQIATDLKQKARSLSKSPLLLLNTLKRYSNLLKRKAIKNQLTSIIDPLSSSILDVMSDMEAEVDNSDNTTSDKVKQITLTRQCENKVKNLLESSRAIGIGGDVDGNAKDLLSKCKRFERHLYDTWVEDMNDAIDNQELSLAMSGKLMEIDSGGILQVNYKESLVVLLRQVRQLSEMGYSIPAEIKAQATEGEQYYRFGIMLKKVSNFYNSMEHIIIPEQKAMLLDSLVAFEEVVSNPTGSKTNAKSSGGSSSITWGNPSECENYVERLHRAAEKLKNENSKLRSVHESLTALTVQLMNINLLSHKANWSKKWSEIQTTMTELSNRYPKERMSKFVNFWNHQVYKALEASYQLGLESLNESMGELKVEMIYTSKQIQFKPPLESIRSKYYTKMKAFIEFPGTKFKGFNENAEGTKIFSAMAARNTDSLTNVYVKSENLFERLASLLGKYSHYTILGSVDLSAYVSENCNSVHDYAANFNALKLKQKDADKLPDIERVDCIKVSLRDFNSTVNDQLQHLHDMLLVGLRNNILQTFKQVDEFLTESLSTLKQTPSTIEEITNAQASWKDISNKKDGVHEISRSCEEKLDLLLTHATSSNAIDPTDVTRKMENLDNSESSRWFNLEFELEAFSELIETQKERAVDILESDVVEMNHTIESFDNRWQSLKPTEMKSWDKNRVEDVFVKLDNFWAEFGDLKEKANTLSNNCVNFGMNLPRFDSLSVVEQDLTKTNSSWTMLREYTNELEKMASQDWISFRTNIFALEDFGKAWNEKLKKKFEEGDHDLVTIHLTDQIEDIKRAMPALKYCRGDPFKEDHWTELLQGKLRLPSNIRLENLTAGHFLMVLDRLSEPSMVQFVKHLQSRAQNEVMIREALQELVAWSQTAELSLLEHELVTADRGIKKTMLIKEWKDLFLELGDKQSLLSSLKDSPYFKPFADTGATYESKLSNLDIYLHQMNQIQRKWLYLEPIFERGALPSEQSRFNRIDTEFRDIMQQVEIEPKLFNLVDERIHHGIANSLTTMLDQLERCQKALADFLEEKRSHMPRFYFIGDDDLLEILGQSQNPDVIQAHLKKLFQALFKVQFDKDKSSITHFCSNAGEVVQLVKPVKTTLKVEEWLTSLATQHRKTLAKQLTDCLKSPTVEDYDAFSSQILCLAENVKFSDRVEDAIVNSSLSELNEQLLEMLQQYTSFDLTTQPIINLKIKSLVLDLIHNRDVVDQLKKARVRDLTDWPWQKQLRYYLDEKTQLTLIKMSNACFDYTYEYQGNSGKLVHTPLTDKCYLTLTQGMHFGFGGNPYGPAGTGKTESVKALGAAFGRQVLVFNCDEGIDFESMGRIFIGLVKSGAWGCFDEFNRLKEDQLSAISQQIQVIQDAIKEKTSNIKILGRNVDVDFNAGIFVTLNPAGKGYGGRSNLPDNLKALFRPVAMGRPDNDLIAEVYLYSEGFVADKSFGRKIVSLFTLSKQLLSVQQHYDWGLRAMKAVLYTAGKLLSAKKKQSSNKLTANEEAEVLIKAIRVNTLSKLTYLDTKRFLALIGDIFVGVRSADVEGGELERAIRMVMEEKPFHLSVEETQVRKMLQLKEALDQRMGCVVVGPSGCGKTTLWSVLKAALIKCGQAVVTHVMNPKAMPRQQLLGSMDLDTREWKDGVLTDAARKAVKEPQEVKTWIVCDGDVDPEWIESLNSVLDDNRLLTMPNGERIAFGDNVNFLFETHDLSFASPATVSRMGMVFLSDDDVDVTRLVHRWLNTQDESVRMNLSSWIDDIFFRALDYVLNQEVVVETTMVGTVLSGLSQIQNCADKNQFLCGVIRGLGGNLSPAARQKFGKELFTWANVRPPDLGAVLDCYCDSGGQLTSYKSSTGGGMIVDSKDWTDAVVPTISVQRTLDMIQPWITQFQPFVLVGPEGCGKNMIIRDAFRKQRSTNITTLHCNAQTTAQHVIMKIQQTCSLFSSPEGRVYRPRDCERLVLYLKDINLPKPDMYNTCMLVAFLQQLLTFDGFYDENLEFLKIDKVQIVCSMNAATTVGRHPLSTRFTAVVRIGVVDYPETKELVSVYDNLLELAFNSEEAPKIPSKYSKDMERNKLASTMVDLYEQVKNKFTVDEHRHYLFTPRDLTGWVKNLLRYDLHGDELLDCFMYEAERVFRDRLVDVDNVNKFNSILAGIVRNNWRHNGNLDNVYFSAFAKVDLAASSRKKEESKGGDGDEGSSSAVTKLLRVKNDEFKTVVAQNLTLYEREEKELNMLLFTEILDHIARVDRVLSEDGGHLLLIGRTGVGRRTAVTLVCYLHNYEFATPAVTRDYGLTQFKNELKAVMISAGVEGKKVCFYLEDHQFTDPAILETVNSLLSAGEVPGLYTHEELEPLLAPLKEMMLDEGGYRTPYDFFVSRVLKNLHVSLAMDPTNKQFTNQCESNPAVYTSCSLLWMGEWSRASMRDIPLMLEGVSDLIRGEHGGESDGGGFRNDAGGVKEGDEGKGGGGKRGEGKSKGGSKAKFNKPFPTASPETVVDSIISIHSSCKPLGAAPLDYMNFLKTWLDLFDKKRNSLTKELGHLQGGLDKLSEASQTVDNLSNNAEKQKKELGEAQVMADQAMDEITNALAGAQDTRRETEDLKEELAKKAEETAERKAAIEGELAEIQPVLDQAKEAVKGIKSENLNEIRSLKTPPAPISDVLSGCLMLLGIQDLSWLSMKKFLGSRGIKDEILTYDAHRITPALMKQVSSLLRSKSNSFDAATIYRVSVAAAPLAAWVKANIKYAMVLERIQPLEKELQSAEKSLKKSQQRLESCEAELAEIDEKVAALKDNFGKKTREAETLRVGLETAQLTLEGAQKLLGQLGGEQGRWQGQADFLRGQINTLPCQMMLCAGFVVYLSQSSETVREDMMRSWMEATKGMGTVKDFSVKKLLSTESQLLVWKGQGLPADNLSQENALVISNLPVEKVPFIVDPAEVSVKWLKTYLLENSKTGMECVASGDPRFTSQVELCVRFGKTLLVLDVDGLDSMLYPLARRDLCHEGARWVVQVGDKTLDFAESFRMVLVTRNPEPNLPPDAAAVVTEVNFTVTKSGLEGQLLSVTIQHEQPELEKQKSAMLKQEEDYKIEVAGLEQNLLEALNTAEGDLLQNISLIDTLTRTKESAAKIAAALEESGKASEELDKQREVYRGFASSGSKLFFLISQLIAVNPMYQFSLASFVKLYQDVLGDPKNANDDIKKRLSRLCSGLEVKSLYFVGRALFKADRPMFSLHLVNGMKENIFEEKEWEAFVGKLVSTDEKPRDFPAWAPPERKRNFAILSENFPRLIENFDFGNSQWNRWSSEQECELNFPNVRGISSFEKVLLVQALRPDRLMSAINGFCCNELDVNSLAPPAQGLDEIYAKETSCDFPIMLITTPGADPSKELEELAVKEVGKEKYKSLAMGGGQQEAALEMLRAAAMNGDWLCLKNLHLVVSWLGYLEKELNVLEKHKDFRLWLTTEPHRSFPPILLQSSLKVTYEAPPGIKKNMQRTYAQWSDDFIRGDDENAGRTQLLFLLAWFHAIVQERRNFIPQGWTKMYEFSTGDLRAGTFAMDCCGGSEGGNDWEMVHGLMMDSIYGGRVDNPFDNRVLKEYLNKYFCDKMIGGRGQLMKGVYVPNTCEPNDYHDAILKIPEEDVPYVFGLPDNIERSVQRARSTAVIEQLRAMGTVGVGEGGFDREQWRTVLGPILDLWSRLKESNEGLLAGGKGLRTSPKKGGRDGSRGESKSGEGGRGDERMPVDIFVEMETDFAANLCKTVDADLQAINKVVYGSGLLTPSVLKVAGELLKGTVPAKWDKIYEGPENSLAWVNGVVQKRVALMEWKKKSNRNELLSDCIELSVPFHPGTFLNALRQQSARVNKCAMDELVLESSWDGRKGGVGGKLPIMVEGLMLQGGVFDGSQLAPAASNGKELMSAPPVVIGFVPKEIGRDGEEVVRRVDGLMIPVYHSLNREKMLVEIEMPCSGEAGEWVLAGVALFLGE